MSTILLLLTATMFDQSRVKPYDAPELGIVFGAKIRGQYEYITAADLVVTGTQSGQAIVDLPNLIVQGMQYQFSVPDDTWSGPQQRGLVPSFSVNATEYTIDRSAVSYATYPTSQNRHRVYEQYGVDDYFWSTPLEVAWRIDGTASSVEGSTTLNIPQFWQLPGILYDPDRANLTEFYGGKYEQIVWSGVLDGLPIDAVAYAHVVGVLIPEPSTAVLFAIGLLMVASRVYAKRA